MPLSSPAVLRQPPLGKVLALIATCTPDLSRKSLGTLTATVSAPLGGRPQISHPIRPHRASGTLELLWKLRRHEHRPARRVLIEENICRLCKPLISATARRVQMARGGDIEDFMQEGFIALISCLRRYDPAGGVDFAAFVPKRIRGAMLDAADKFNRHSACPKPQLAPREIAADPAPPQWMIDLEIAHLLSPLPPVQRNIVILCILDGMSCRAAAAQLGIHASTISRQLRSALDTMRKHAGV
ncbi:MAG: sigma-70 family RNA polymerase sigma factor [Phycisphaerae bacterium]